MRKSIKEFIRYSFGQVASLRAHELNRRAPHQVWLNYLCDQASVRLGGGRPQVCDFLGNNKLALTRYTAPGVRYARVGCMHDYEEIDFFATPSLPAMYFSMSAQTQDHLVLSPFLAAAVRLSPLSQAQKRTG